MFDESKYECFGYDEKNPDGSVRCHCVKAISNYAGKTVAGYAKCHPDTSGIGRRVRLWLSHVAQLRLPRSVQLVLL